MPLNRAIRGIQTLKTKMMNLKIMTPRYKSYIIKRGIMTAKLNSLWTVLLLPICDQPGLRTTENNFALPSLAFFSSSSPSSPMPIAAAEIQALSVVPFGLAF